MYMYSYMSNRKYSTVRCVCSMQLSMYLSHMVAARTRLSGAEGRSRVGAPTAAQELADEAEAELADRVAVAEAGTATGSLSSVRRPCFGGAYTASTSSDSSVSASRAASRSRALNSSASPARTETRFSVHLFGSLTHAITTE